MDIALKKLDLMRRLMLIWDEATLARVAKTIEEAVPDEDMDLTEEDLEELERRRAEHLRGEGKSYTREEAMSLCARTGNEDLSTRGAPGRAG